MRILIVSDNASSRFGGEAFLPYNYFRFLVARQIDVHLLVHDRNRPELLGKFGSAADRIHFVRDTAFHRVVFQCGKLLPRRLASITTDFLIQLATQLAQRRVIKLLNRSVGFDVVHVPIPVSPRTPSLMYGLNAAVVIGPLNGGMQYPVAFRRRDGRGTRLFVLLGRKLTNFLNSVFPGKLNAEVILVANERTRSALPTVTRSKVIELVENGVDLEIWRRSQRMSSKSDGLRLIFVGRLVDWKALEIVLEAMSRMRDRIDVTLEIIGDGPMRRPWETLTQQLDLSSRVKFRGWMTQEECANELAQADVFVLPSLFECGGAVVLEAMAVGLPVIATAWGGPLDYIEEDCGILVPPTSREVLVQGFASAIGKLAISKDSRAQLAEAGYRRVKERYTWERKIDQILQIYAEAARASTRADAQKHLF